jgi:hypothetical protein
MRKTVNKKVGKKRWDVITETLDCNAKLIGAEIGVEQGKTSKMLLSRMSKLHLILVDRWCVTPKGDSYFNGSRIMSRYKDAEWQSVYKKAIANIAPYRNRVTLYKTDSMSAAQKVDDGSLDFIFIDADHSFEGVCRDIDAWLPKVKAGGYIFFHDYENANTYTGVKEAIENRLGIGVVKVSHDHTAIYRKGEQS